MELGVADVVCGFLHGNALGIVNGEPFEQAPELDIDFALLVVMRHLNAVRTLSFLEHSDDAEKVREDRSLFYGRRIEEVEVTDLHKPGIDPVVNFGIRLVINDKRLFDQVFEVLIIKKTLQKIYLEQEDESYSFPGAGNLVKHVRRDEEDLFLLEYYSSVFKDISVRSGKRNRDLKAGMSVSRVVFRLVVVPDPHVRIRYEIYLFDIVADDPSGEVSDRLLIIARNRIVA